MQGDRNEERSAQRNGARLLPLEHEILRSGIPISVPVPAPASPPKGEERLPLFWRICGSTILSIAALVALTLYQQLSVGINELRNEQSHLGQAVGDLVKKDEFNSRILTLAHRMEELQGANGSTADLGKERTALLERQLKAVDDERKQLAKDYARELQQLRDRLAAMEGRITMATPASRPH